MTTDAQPAAPSAAETPTAVESAVVSHDITAFREARRAERSGTPLVTPTPADSAPAPVVEQPGSTEPSADAASEPAKPQKNAESRVKELLADRAKEREARERAEARIHELERLATAPRQEQTPPAAPSPAPVSEKFPSYDEHLAEHPDTSYEDYLDLRADFRAQHAFKALQRQESEQRAQQEQTAGIRHRDAQFAERMTKATAADPELLTTMSEPVKRLRPFDALVQGQDGHWRDPSSGQFVRPSHAALAEHILRAEEPARWMRHFSDHPEDFERFGALAPDAFYRELGKLEARWESKPVPVTPPKTVTDAPAPLTRLDARPAVPADPVEAAVNQGDIRAFRAARQAQRAGQR